MVLAAPSWSDPFHFISNPACRGAGREGEEIDSCDYNSSSPVLRVDRTHC